MGDNIKINLIEIRSKHVDWTQPVIRAFPPTNVGIWSVGGHLLSVYTY
jgi:hypothetical protein